MHGLAVRVCKVQCVPFAVYNEVQTLLNQSQKYQSERDRERESKEIDISL